jgi:Fe-S cluster assembly iron-binding protein IscA
VTITPEAQAYLTELLSDSEGLIIDLISGGCTGYQVSLKKTPLSECTESNTEICTKVFIPTGETQRILQDAELILKDDEFNKGLHIVPPKDYDACGCGSSFAPRTATHEFI